MKLRRTLVRKIAVIVVLVVALVFGFMSRPKNVEGVYSAGKLISCMCDCSHYIRFYYGSVIHYATNHEPAKLLGRYEVDADGSVSIYMTPLRKGDPEKILFKIDQPRAGFAFATTEEDQSTLLTRIPNSGEVADLIANQEVMNVTIHDDAMMVTTFYDSFLSVISEETKTLKKRDSEQE